MNESPARSSSIPQEDRQQGREGHRGLQTTRSANTRGLSPEEIARIPDAKTGVRYAWHPVWPLIIVGDDGDVISFRLRGSNSLTKQSVTAFRMSDHFCKGYPAICISVSGKIKMRCRHLLVLETFVGPCPNGLEASHEDGNRLNPRLTNLCRRTRKSNHVMKRIHGTDQSGERHPNAILSIERVREVRSLSSTGLTDAEVGRRLNVRPSSVYLIKTGKQWSRWT